MSANETRGNQVLLYMPQEAPQFKGALQFITSQSAGHVSELTAKLTAKLMKKGPFSVALECFQARWTVEKSSKQRLLAGPGPGRAPSPLRRQTRANGRTIGQQRMNSSPNCVVTPWLVP